VYQCKSNDRGHFYALFPIFCRARYALGRLVKFVISIHREMIIMAIFVLVHGTGHGGWCWKKVAPILRAAGSEIYAQTLTGVCDRSHLVNCGVNLTTHITDITNLLFYEDLSDGLILAFPVYITYINYPE
jgi:hypothetical protein